MGKTIYITDKDALDVDRVIVSSTGMEYKLLYSCDEIDNYENRLKANMVAMLTELQLDIQEVNTAPQFLTDDNVKDFRECVDTIIQEKINSLKESKE